MQNLSVTLVSVEDRHQTFVLPEGAGLQQGLLTFSFNAPRKHKLEPVIPDSRQEGLSVNTVHTLLIHDSPDAHSPLLYVSLQHSDPSGRFVPVHFPTPV